MSAQGVIEAAWEKRTSLSPGNAPRELRAAVEEVIAGLDAGRLRVAEKSGGEWLTHQWIKKAVLLSFRLEDNRVMDARYYDKVPSKFDSFDFDKGGFRVVPPAAVRRGASISKKVGL
jgi:2,3,4,5-tetrahydropyridine-2-carboxylate N-succinyltransferase